MHSCILVTSKASVDKCNSAVKWLKNEANAKVPEVDSLLNCNFLCGVGDLLTFKQFKSLCLSFIA